MKSIRCLRRGFQSMVGTSTPRVSGEHKGLSASNLADCWCAVCKDAIAVPVQGAWRVLVCPSCVIKRGPAMALESILGPFAEQSLDSCWQDGLLKIIATEWHGIWHVYVRNRVLGLL